MRCASRLAPFGAPTWMTRSTSPQSMPRSSVEVATTARRLLRLHRLLDAAALADVERAVMQRDRQAVLVDAPQLLEQHLGLAARVDEKQRRAVPLDRLVDLGNGVAGGVAGPGHALLGIEDGDLGLGAAGDGDQLGHRAGRVLAHQPAPQFVRLRDGRGQPDRLDAGPERCAAAPGRAPADGRASTSPANAARRRSRSADRRRSGRRAGAAISSASCSGVVSRMSGGASFWRCRLCGGVSPVRVSMVSGSAISPTGLPRLRSMSTASALSGEM